MEPGKKSDLNNKPDQEKDLVAPKGNFTEEKLMDSALQHKPDKKTSQKNYLEPRVNPVENTKRPAQYFGRGTDADNNNIRDKRDAASSSAGTSIEEGDIKNHEEKHDDNYGENYDDNDDITNMTSLHGNKKGEYSIFHIPPRLIIQFLQFFCKIFWLEYFLNHEFYFSVF